jgi:hypothetical protein
MLAVYTKRLCPTRQFLHTFLSPIPRFPDSHSQSAKSLVVSEGRYHYPDEHDGNSPLKCERWEQRLTDPFRAEKLTCVEKQQHQKQFDEPRPAFTLPVTIDQTPNNRVRAMPATPKVIWRSIFIAPPFHFPKIRWFTFLQEATA